MKRFLLLLAAILVSTSVSCGNDGSNAPTGFMEISDEGLTYHLYVPDEWTKDVSTGMTSAYYNGRDPSNVSMTAFALTDASVTTPEEYWQSQEADLKAIFPNLTYVDESACTLDGVAGRQYIYTATLSGSEYKFMQLVTLKDNTVYLFTYTALTDKYDEHIEDVLSMLDYFDFK